MNRYVSAAHLSDYSFEWAFAYRNRLLLLPLAKLVKLLEKRV